jgi:hypothetical protein
MSYYVRILGTSDPDIHIDELIDGLSEVGLTAKFSRAELESAAKWSVLLVANEAGNELIQVERNPIVEGDLGFEELEEFKESIEEYKPASAARWLLSFFDRVKVIYAFQLMDDAFEGDNFAIVSALREIIWNKTGGIFQSDSEGFTNEEGYAILWQFSDEAKGEWNMAVQEDASGKWTRFTMELGDENQREEFWKGKVPKGAVRL